MNEKVLRSSTGWKIGTIFLAALFIVPCTFGEYYFISSAIKSGFAKAAVSELLLMQLVFIPFYALSVVTLLQVFRTFVKMNDDEFEYFSGIIKHITIPANKIKSFFITRQYTLNYHITYCLDSGKEKTIKIEMIFKNNEAFGQWLIEHHNKFNYSTLSVNKSITEEIKSNNVELDDEDISQDISKYKKIAKCYNYAGVSLAVIPFVLILFLDNVKNIIRVSFIISILMFFIGLVLIKVSKEIVRLDEAQGQTYPSIFRGILVGPAFNIIYSAPCINLIQDFKKYLLVCIFILIIVTGIIRLFDLKQLQFVKEKKKMDKFSIGCAYFLLFFIIFGNVPGINQFFSFNKEYDSYQTTVLDKKGDDTLIVSSWLDPDKTKSIDVSKKTFKKIEVNSKMEIRVRKGALGIKYYTSHLLSSN